MIPALGRKLSFSYLHLKIKFLNEPWENGSNIQQIVHIRTITINLHQISMPPLLLANRSFILEHNNQLLRKISSIYFGQKITLTTTGPIVDMYKKIILSCIDGSEMNEIRDLQGFVCWAIVNFLVIFISFQSVSIRVLANAGMDSESRQHCNWDFNWIWNEQRWQQKEQRAWLGTRCGYNVR